MGKAPPFSRELTKGWSMSSRPIFLPVPGEGWTPTQCHSIPNWGMMWLHKPRTQPQSGSQLWAIQMGGAHPSNNGPRVQTTVG